MATAESVKAKIAGLITKANNATGKEDTTLNDAVDSLIAGFGTGGGGGGRLPAGYTELPYLNSDGGQHIETGWRAKAGDVLTMSMAITSGSSESAFGGYPDEFELYYKFSYTTNPSVAVWTNKSAITVLENHSGTVEFGQVTTLKLRFDADMTSGTVRLFAYRLDRFPFAGKILFATVENANGEKVLDYVPCIHPSGEFGMYDLARDMFYQNAGSGKFF